MPNTLLPQTELELLQQKDITYRSAVPRRDVSIDINPLTCDVVLLPYLANIYLTPYWDESWSEEVKRLFVSALPELHKRMGTVWSIKRALELTGLHTTDYPAKLKEGLNGEYANGEYNADGLTYAGGGSRYGYIIYLSRPITTALSTKARRLIEQFAPVQCRLVALVFNQALEANGLKIANGDFNAGTIKIGAINV